MHDLDLQIVGGVDTELAHDLGRAPATPGGSFRQASEGLLKGDVENILGLLQAASVHAALDVGPVAAVVGQHALAIRVFAHGARQAQETQRILLRGGFHFHAGQERLHLGLVVVFAELHIGAVAAGLDEDGTPRLGIVTQFDGTRSAFQNLGRAFHVKLVRCHTFGDCGALVAALEIRPVAADANVDHTTLVVFAQFQGTDFAGIDFGLNQVLEPFLVTFIAKVKGAQVRQGIHLAPGNLVEIILHARREGHIDEPSEVLFHQLHHGEGHEGGNEGAALLDHILAMQNRVDDRGISARTAHAFGFEFLDQ